jgi:NADP-dependent 3-hydroxy acid dehydrogenase YdfG
MRRGQQPRSKSELVLPSGPEPAIRQIVKGEEEQVRILIVGATGTIGVPVVQALEVRHEVILASYSGSAFTVDFGEAESIRRLYAKVGRVDAVVSVAGLAAFRPLLALTDADFALGLNNKLMGQVNLVRFGIEMVTDGGSFTLTSGILSRMPMPGSAAVSPVNAALEGFGRAAALELPPHLRFGEGRRLGPTGSTIGKENLSRPFVALLVCFKACPAE